MKLADKGPIKPPPSLQGPAALTVETVMGWTEIIAAAHWDLFKPGHMNGVDFYAGEHEIGHIHLDGTLHLATPPELGEPLVERGLAKRFPYGGVAYSGWTLLRIRTEAEAMHASWLFRLAYDRQMGTPLPTLKRRIAAYARRNAAMKLAA